MYHPTKIQGLSNIQINKMLKGHGIRVKAGGDHLIHMSQEQAKKLGLREHEFSFSSLDPRLNVRLIFI